MNTNKFQIPRDYYLNKLISQKDNSKVKILTGMTGCGKNYTLSNIYKNYLLNIGVSEDHIIHKDIEKDHITDVKRLSEELKNITKSDETYYLFINKIHFLKNTTDVFFDLRYFDDRFDIYLTTDNSPSIPKESDRKCEIIKFRPVSFNELYTVANTQFPCEEHDSFVLLNRYLSYGGLPSVLQSCDDDSKNKQINRILKNIIIKNILYLNKIQKREYLLNTLKILISNTGKLINPNRIRNIFSCEYKTDVSKTTLKKYIDSLEEYGLIEVLSRYDIDSHRIKTTPIKCYFPDLSVYNLTDNSYLIDENQKIPNLIFNELKCRGYSVTTGYVTSNEIDKSGKKIRNQLPVDFIVQHNTDTYYIQTKLSSDKPEDINLKIKALNKIRDKDCKKVIISQEGSKPVPTQLGIEVIDLLEFLTKDSL